MAKERPGFAGYSFGTTDEDVEATTSRWPDLPETDETGKASFTVNPRERADDRRVRLKPRSPCSMARSGGRAVERKFDAAGRRRPRTMIGVKPLFSGRSLGTATTPTFDVMVATPDGTTMRAIACAMNWSRSIAAISITARDNVWNYEPIKATERVADGQVRYSPPDRPTRIIAAGGMGPLSSRCRQQRTAAGRPRRSAFDAGFYADATADTPDLLEVALDKTENISRAIP